MAVGDVYEVVDVQSYQGQEILNVYYYRQGAAFVPVSGTTAQALADEWSDTILPEVLLVQSNDILHVETRVRNLFTPLDQGETVTGVTGTGATGTIDTLPSFAAWGLTLNHDNPVVRPGGKRFVGVPEIGQTEGVPTAAFVTALEGLADALAAPITGGLIISDDIMFPVVVKRVREGVAPNFTYRLPENVGELVFGTLIEALVKLFVTSQVSRKFGVGV